MLLSIYEWSKDGARYHLVAPAGEVPFKLSETFRKEWIEVARVPALSPFVRPIPSGHALFIAERADAFPYHTLRIRRVENIFTPAEKGVYFIAQESLPAGWLTLRRDQGASHLGL